jgi:hypothetical protein
MLKLISTLVLAAAACSASDLYLSWNVNGAPTFQSGGENAAEVVFTAHIGTASGPTVSLICTDFYDTMPDSLNNNGNAGTKVSSVFDYSTLSADVANGVYGHSSDPLRFDSAGSNYTSGPKDTATQYEIAGYLISQLFTAQGGVAANIAIYQPAIWYALDQSTNYSKGISASELNTTSLNAYNAASAYIATNSATFLATIAPNVLVYTPDKSSDASKFGSGYPQEFMTYAVPEPASFLLMGAGLLLGGLSLKRFRRK